VFGVVRVMWQSHHHFCHIIYASGEGKVIDEMLPV